MITMISLNVLFVLLVITSVTCPSISLTPDDDDKGIKLGHEVYHNKLEEAIKTPPAHIPHPIVLVPGLFGSHLEAQIHRKQN